VRDITQVGHIGPAISIPIESTNAGITAGLTAATTAVNAGTVVNTVTHAVSGANVAGAAAHAAANAATPGKGGKVGLPKIGVLPHRKKLP
jgi:hypothetical protein